MIGVFSNEEYKQHTIYNDDYNYFYGSLKSLKDLSKLEDLMINCTNINEGLEYLPDSLESFHYETEDPNFQVAAIDKLIGESN